MLLQTDKAKWTIDMDGEWLMLRVGRKEAARVCSEMNPDKPYDVSVSEHRERRSLNANRYMWQLCAKLAESLSGSTGVRHSKEDVY